MSAGTALGGEKLRAANKKFSAPVEESVEAESLVRLALERGTADAKGLQALKNEFSLTYRQGAPLSNIELLHAYRRLVARGDIAQHAGFAKLFRKRNVRSHSGIANITVITKAFACPGKCIFCPTEPDMPKSYLSNEPAIMRAILNGFDAYRQTVNRLESLEKTGHNVDKIDVIVSGGTWSFYPKKYQTAFTRAIYNALNSVGEDGKVRKGWRKARTLAEAQKVNETAQSRCIGLSFETRPDHIDEKELKRLRMLGCTKIEIGVQSLDDEVLRLNRRGHGIAETKKAIQLIRDAGYKINCHMMPNLYGSTPEKDERDMIEMFENPAYRPDWMKIYPCMVVPWSQLEAVYKAGKHVPYTDEQLIDLMLKVKPRIPEYCRITRLIRDIPATTIVGGSKVSNLRQIIQQRMKAEGLQCRCIRCRQVKDEAVLGSDLEMKVMEFDAAEGREFFITFDDVKRDKLASLLRLRFSSYSLQGRPHFLKELEGAALVREVHAYGEHVKVAGELEGASQHIGLGRRMMQEAEKISRTNGYKKLAVISGIGVREYYRKLGYSLEGTYMVKEL